jgi:hypothetical protein
MGNLNVHLQLSPPSIKTIDLRVSLAQHCACLGQGQCFQSEAILLTFSCCCFHFFSIIGGVSVTLKFWDIHEGILVYGYVSWNSGVWGRAKLENS